MKHKWFMNNQYKELSAFQEASKIYLNVELQAVHCFTVFLFCDIELFGKKNIGIYSYYQSRRNTAPTEAEALKLKHFKIIKCKFLICQIDFQISNASDKYKSLLYLYLVKIYMEASKKWIFPLPSKKSVRDFAACGINRRY